MQSGYWNRVLSSRIGRRRALASTAGLGVGATALSLVGCGSGGDSSSGEDLGLLTRPDDTTSRAVRGGVYQDFEASDIQGMDPNAGSSVRAQFVAKWVYPLLLKTKTSFDGTRVRVQEGDLAESFEFSNDGLTLTFRLRPGVNWDSRAPTSGRPVDAQDVMFSAERFQRLSPHAVNFFNSRSDTAPIESLQAPDSRTIVMRLAFPYVPLLATLVRGLNMYILPRESDGGYDPRNDARGAGPWILSDYRPSAHLEFRRNPDYYVKDRPFFDGWRMPIVTEYATQLAQFRAGNIWSGVARQEDIIPLKRDFPELQIFKGEYLTGTPSFFFGFQGPFRDARLRQALSMVIDRQLMADVLSDTETFQAAGLPSTVLLNNFIGVGWEGYWIDPQGREMGSSADFLKLNLAEARKLLNAAGVTGKLQTSFHYPHNGYGNVYQQQIQILHGMVQDSGLFDARLVPLDYQSDYIPNIHFGGPSIGAWDGFALTPAGQGDDPGHQLLVQYHSGGAATRQPVGIDRRLDQMIDEQLRELDTNKRIQQIKDIQKYMTTTMITTPVGSQAAGYTANWPWVGNFGAVRGGQNIQSERYPFLWYDKATHDRIRGA